jgi:hypothetical protein
VITIPTVPKNVVYLLWERGGIDDLDHFRDLRICKPMLKTDAESHCSIVILLPMQMQGKFHLETSFEARREPMMGILSKNTGNEGQQVSEYIIPWTLGFCA